MKIGATIQIERIVPENRLIAPHWVASLGAFEAGGPDPVLALRSLLDKIVLDAIEKANE